MPAEPFADWGTQHFEPIVGFYWYVEPATLICQSVISHATVQIIDTHNDIVDRVLERRRKEIDAAGGLCMLFDWRSVQSYDADARARQRTRMQARGKTYARRTVVVIAPSNKLLQMAVGAANLFATMLFKSSIEVLTDPTPAVRSAKLVPPARGASFW